MTYTGADMPVAAAVILIPLSVVIYTVAGGLKATFTSSYLHTVRPCFQAPLCSKLPFYFVAFFFGTCAQLCKA